MKVSLGFRWDDDENEEDECRGEAGAKGAVGEGGAEEVKSSEGEGEGGFLCLGEYGDGEGEELEKRFVVNAWKRRCWKKKEKTLTLM